MVEYFNPYFTEKQANLGRYVMERLGFFPHAFTKAYVDILAHSAYRFRSLSNINPDTLLQQRKQAHQGSTTTFRLSRLDPPDFYDYDPFQDMFVKKNYSIIDYLIHEYTVKNNYWRYQKEYKHSNFISATDIANYTYCPAAYAISKTFALPATDAAVTGTKLHNEVRLSSQYKGVLQGQREYEDTVNRPFFQEIRMAKIIHSGHNNQVNNFMNKSESVVGNPDYIFQKRTGEKFMVEEKFLRKTTNTPFFQNHILQLATYLRYIEQHPANYGYLLYWFYEKFDETIRIAGAKFLTIQLKEYNTILDNNIARLRSFQQNRNSFFDLTLLTPAKCAGCVYNRLCAHKTGRYNDITLPYDSKYLQMYRSSYNLETSIPRIDLPKLSNDDLPF
jgi:CRISPR/Cas system-associated exonuclease Cas4 (RecB family)